MWNHLKAAECSWNSGEHSALMAAYRLACKSSKSPLIKLFRVFRVRSLKLSCQNHPDLSYALDRACIFMRKECDGGLAWSGCALGCRASHLSQRMRIGPGFSTCTCFLKAPRKRCALESAGISRRCVTCTLKGMRVRGGSRKRSAALYCHPGSVGKPDERIRAVYLFSLPSSWQHCKTIWRTRSHSFLLGCYP